MESRLDRIISLSELILNRLQSEERLSHILPQIRLLAEMNGHNAHVAWVDFEIYGMLHTPFAKIPFEEQDDKLGGLLFAELHEMPDIGAMDYENVIEDAFKQPNLSDLTKNKWSNLSSIESLEEAKYEEPRNPPNTRDAALIEFRARIFSREAAKVVHRVRAYAHQYVGKVWQNTLQEKENQYLLGLDYKIVINNLDALETGVGQELIAALQNLWSENPANWKLAALGCRNIIIKLGDSLWKVPCTKYWSELDNKELDLVGEKEKNRLYAYIDYYHRRVEVQDKDTLKQLHVKVWPIYDIGSKGKREIRHEEARTIIIDTFEFVGKLDDITKLEPLEEI